MRYGKNSVNVLNMYSNSVGTEYLPTYLKTWVQIITSVLTKRKSGRGENIPKNENFDTGI